jgi:hypothetical protein
MSTSVAKKLSDLVEAVRALPEQAQHALVEEFSDRLSDFTDSRLSDEQRAEVDRRLATPRYAETRQGAPALCPLRHQARMTVAFREEASPTSKRWRDS